MEKALKYERQSKWAMITMFVVAVVTIFRPEQSFNAVLFFVIVTVYIHNGASRAIKELKREIESLKSDDSTESVEPTPPEEE